MARSRRPRAVVAVLVLCGLLLPAGAALAMVLYAAPDPAGGCTR